MAIRVLSFDFDGCLFNPTYTDKLLKPTESEPTESKPTESKIRPFFEKKGSYELNKQLKSIIESNKEFLEKIKNQNKNYGKVYALVGSNRQSFAVDQSNSFRNNTGTCTHAIIHLSDWLGVILDKFLLADIYGNKQSGASFGLILEEIEKREPRTFKNVSEHDDFAFDKTKVTILYAQMHKIARENPGEQIVFDFYDDKLGILQALSKFYLENPYLIPSNVTLNLNQYLGESVPEEPMFQIQGKGFIDIGYGQTVKDLVSQALAKEHPGLDIASVCKKGKEFCVASNAEPKLLKNRKLIEPGSSDVSVDLLSQINSEGKASGDAVGKFLLSLCAIKMKEKELLNKRTLAADGSPQKASYENAAAATKALYDGIFSALNQYSQDGNKENFKQNVGHLIEGAKNSELKYHRGYLKQILCYTGLAILAVLTIATAGLAYGVAGGVNYACNGQFFFKPNVNTDSVNKVLDLEEAVNELASRFLAKP